MACQYSGGITYGDGPNATLLSWGDIRHVLAQHVNFLAAEREALALTVHMAKTFYPEVTQFRPFDELRSLLSQIDNMVCGLQRKPCDHVWFDGQDACANCGSPREAASPADAQLLTPEEQ